MGTMIGIPTLSNFLVANVEEVWIRIFSTCPSQYNICHRPLWRLRIAACQALWTRLPG